ncbi:hypothetical protein XthCFBP4691_20650 [Xanthomonas theicola]|uniref:Uncharacterized protein n=1 Tax=Xanthomonas theicola TaxID=56464 RepID=A0A2S6YZ33_9XANT|nr:hypothetical protein XthCFBP4691_20650 [Xanthomonas theicola]
MAPVRVGRRRLLGAPVPCAATCSGLRIHGQGRPALRRRPRFILLYPSPFGRRPSKRRLTAEGARAGRNLLPGLPEWLILSRERPVCAG